MINTLQYLPKNVLRLSNTFRSSVAFYPSLISFAFFLSALIVVYVEQQVLQIESSSLFIIRDANTARTILSTIIGSIISLSVFSFSMVMLLLNQAANNYSPRVLPGLITDRRHQIVLGIFIGTIVYCLVLIVQIIPEAKDYNIPGLSVFLSMILTLICISLFVYFLHNISKSIQVTDILRQVYNKTIWEIQKTETLLEDARPSESLKATDWYLIKASETGYFQRVRLDIIRNIASQKECSIYIAAEPPCFIIEGNPIAYSTKKLTKKMQNQLAMSLVFNADLLVENNYIHGFKQISEIVTKAMSPGINDPGTALNGIHYLTSLFCEVSVLKGGLLEIEVAPDQAVFIQHPSFKTLLYQTLVGIRQYSKHDVNVVLALIRMFERLFKTPRLHTTHRRIILNELMSIEQDIKSTIANPYDLKKLQQDISSVKLLARQNPSILTFKIHMTPNSNEHIGH